MSERTKSDLSVIGHGSLRSASAQDDYGQNCSSPAAAVVAINSTLHAMPSQIAREGDDGNLREDFEGERGGLKANEGGGGRAAKRGVDPSRHAPFFPRQRAGRKKAAGRRKGGS